MEVSILVFPLIQMECGQVRLEVIPSSEANGKYPGSGNMIVHRSPDNTVKLLTPILYGKQGVSLDRA